MIHIIIIIGIISYKYYYYYYYYIFYILLLLLPLLFLLFSEARIQTRHWRCKHHKKKQIFKKLKNDSCATDANKVIQLKITVMIISWSWWSRIFGYISKSLWASQSAWKARSHDRFWSATPIITMKTMKPTTHHVREFEKHETKSKNTTKAACDGIKIYMKCWWTAREQSVAAVELEQCNAESISSATCQTRQCCCSSRLAPHLTPSTFRSRQTQLK